MKKLLSILLCLVMVMGVFAMTVSAAEGKTQITTMAELTTGKYIIQCTNNVYLGSWDGSWVTTSESEWTLTVNGTKVKMADCNGKYIAPKGGNNNGLKEGQYEWEVSCTNGTFTFAGTGSDTVKLSSNKGQQNKFRAYKNGTISGDTTTYTCTFKLYKIGEGAGGGSDTEDVPQDIETTIDGLPTTADGKTYITTGKITHIDGKSIYIMDSTGAFCVRLANDPASTLAVGDGIKAKGTVSQYKGMPQLNVAADADYEEVTAPNVDTTPANVSVGDINTNKPLSALVKLTGTYTVSQVYDGDNHQYTTPNITLKDENGKTVDVYKAPVSKVNGAWPVAVDDVVTVTITGIVSCSNAYMRVTPLNADSCVITIEGADEDESCTHANAAWTPDGDGCKKVCPDCSETVDTKAAHDFTNGDCVCGTKAPTSDDKEDDTTKPSKPVWEKVDAPEAGVAFKLGMYQETLGKVLYFNGGYCNHDTVHDYHLGATDKVSEAVDVYVEETNGGYFLYFMKDGVKTYIELCTFNTTSTSLKLVTTPTTVYTWNAEYKTFVATVDGLEMFLGSYGDRDFFSASKTEKLGADNYASGLYVETAADTADSFDIIAVLLVAVSAVALGGVLLNRKKFF